VPVLTKHPRAIPLFALGLLAFVAGACGVAAARSSTGWTIRSLGLVPSMPTNANLDPQAINADGEVIGNASTKPTMGGRPGRPRPKLVFRAFAWQHGRLTVLKDGIDAMAINDSGWIIGQGMGPLGLLWESADTTPVEIATLGGAGSVPAAINDLGQVVGQSAIANGDEHAFLWQSGRMTDLGTLGGTMPQAMAINNAGQVIGVSTTARGATEGFLWQRGRMSALPSPPGYLTLPVAINDRGEILGNIATPGASGSIVAACVWVDGRITSLKRFGHGPSTGVAINDRGDILLEETQTEAALLEGTKVVQLGSLGGGSTDAAALSDDDEVTGSRTPAEARDAASPGPTDG
jgi:probable HAF family extracellular repeat protein